MNHQLIGLVIDTAGALIMMALAVWVWRLRPMNRLNRAFAALASSLGLSILLLNLGWVFFYGDEGDHRKALLGAAGGIGLVVAAAFVLLLERRIPLPRSFAPKRLWRSWPMLLTLLYAAIFTSLFFRLGLDVLTDAGLLQVINAVGVNIFTALIIYLLARLALRYTESRADEGEVRWQCATIALALGSFPLFSTAATAIAPPDPDVVGDPANGLLLVPLILAALSWIVAGAGRNGRLATVTGLVLLAVTLSGYTAAAVYGTLPALNSGAIGILRLTGTALLAYAIVRHQLFDIDLKLKWTISRGTLAAIFIATFFVASEGAQALFSEFANDELVGVLAAGLLVFFIAPLQRFADRLSDAALPHVVDTPAYREERRRAIYLAAIRSALKDGIVTDTERSVLATLADELGLTSREALDLERQATTGV